MTAYFVDTKAYLFYYHNNHFKYQCCHSKPDHATDSPFLSPLSLYMRDFHIYRKLVFKLTLKFKFICNLYAPFQNYGSILADFVVIACFQLAFLLKFVAE